ncbi:hypothetical protein CGG82_24495 [Vibrio parahaemolyticus]|nr:hypothetical protein [Vibrio parahaemolyticus]OKY39185.1 hypothetical protein BT101_23485 [Vibrio parahaemolyticus]TOR06210.1 hypothetical protein CGG82_24495 [Vibrio parahaemolyticus]
MKLLNCHVCGSELASDADMCPRCRSQDPFELKARKNRRDKYLALFLSVGLIGYLTYEFISKDYMSYVHALFG